MKKAVSPAVATLPNCITALRIVGTVLLLFLAPVSVIFFIIYTICGITDILDGWIARATNNTSELGAKLDSAADLLFYAVLIIKLMPILRKLIPAWIWYIVGGILVVRIISYITAAVKFRRFASPHTKINKISGASIFLLPYSLITPYAVGYCVTVVIIASLAAIQDLVLFISQKEYHSNMKALF